MRESLETITLEISEQCLARRLRSVSRVISARYDDALRPFGLRNTQLTLLVAIARWDGTATPSDLAEHLHLEKSTLSRNLARLEERGWISRRSEGRHVQLALTEAGADTVRRAYPAWQAAQAEISTWAEEGEVEAVSTLFDRLPEESRV